MMTVSKDLVEYIGAVIDEVRITAREKEEGYPAVNLLDILEELLAISREEIENPAGILPCRRKEIRETVAYIGAHAAEKIGRDDLAEEVNFSGTYLSRLFHAETGKRMAVYRREYRLLRARDLLKQTDASVAEIALLVGMRSASYFSSQYRAYFGMSPTMTRKVSAAT